MVYRRVVGMAATTVLAMVLVKDVKWVAWTASLKAWY